MSLARNLTYVAVVEYIESQPPLATLAANLDDTVDGNVHMRTVVAGQFAPSAVRTMTFHMWYVGCRGVGR